MASNKIRGITIELGADTSQVTKALGDINSDIKQTSKELKDVDKLLKLDPSNTELLAQKQELLAKNTKDLSTKLTTLKEAQSKCNTETDAGKKAYDILQREIVETSNQLEEATKAQNNFNIKLEEFKGKAQEVSDGASKIASATKGISTAAAGALAGIVALGVNAAATADDLNTLAAQSGFTTEQLQKWQYASDVVDVSMDDIVSAATKLKKNMASTSSDVTAAFETLGVSVKDASGEYKDSTVVFNEVIQALSQIPNETERDILAMSLLGKNASSLTGIIDDGGQAMNELGEQAKELGLILSQDTLDGANELNDAIDTLKASVSQAALQMGASIAEDLIPIVDELLETAMNVMEFLMSIDSDTWVVIGTILAVVSAISPIAGIITAITGVMAALNTTMLPIIAVIVGITAAIAGIILVIKNWGKITDWMSEKWQAFKDGVVKVIEKIKSVFNFEWALPKLKLPHVKIEGSFSLVPPKVPKFSIDWYAKAMDTGMILNTPTIFGMNSNGQLMAGGERGSEIIVGTNSLMNMIQSASSGGSDRLADMIASGSIAVVLDSGAIVGQLTPEFDKAMGQLALRRTR